VSGTAPPNSLTTPSWILRASKDAPCTVDRFVLLAALTSYESDCPLVTPKGRRLRWPLQYSAQGEADNQRPGIGDDASATGTDKAQNL